MWHCPSATQMLTRLLRFQGLNSAGIPVIVGAGSRGVGKHSHCTTMGMLALTLGWLVLLSRMLCDLTWEGSVVQLLRWHVHCCSGPP